MTGRAKGLVQLSCKEAVNLADKWLNLIRLELEVYTDNEPAIRLYKKFGFIIEGTLAQYSFRDGQFVDSHLMARLRK
jgi:putative acetyltransferase